MSDSRRRTKTVFEVFQILTEDGASIRPGAVNTYLREQGAPMGAWEVRGEFSNLLEMGLIALNEAEGVYLRVEGAVWPATEALSQTG